MAGLANETEYNPRVAVPHALAITEGWARRAAETRARHPPIEIRYGAHPRETLDLFRVDEARGCLLFIHGGYWRALSKAEHSWVADGFLSQGISVALLNYPLCPDVRLARICEAARAAFVHLHRAVLTPAEQARLVVAGHSAGGYLAALHLATSWADFGLPSDPIAGIVPISGVFGLAPLLETSMNEQIRLDASAAAALSLHDSPLRARARAAFVVGGDESHAFHAQSADLARHWSALAPSVTDLLGRHHFDVVDGLAVPGSVLNGLVMGMLTGSPETSL